MSSNLLKAISIVAFIISGLFTIMLMTSAIVGIIATILTIGIAVILELCKCAFFYFGVSGNLNGRKIPSIIRGLCFFIALALFVSSIIASLSFLQNNNNKTKNYALESSQDSQNKSTNVKAQQDLITVKKAEISTYNKQIETITSNAAASSKKYNSIGQITNAKETMEQSVKDIQKVNDKLAKANAELITITKVLQTENSRAVKADMGNTKGYTAFLEVIADKLNESPDRKDNPISSSEIETWFFGALAIIFEFVAVLLFYFSMLAKEPIGVRENKTSSLPIKRIRTNKIIGSDNITVKNISPMDDEIKSNKQIGFYKPKITNLNNVKIPENPNVITKGISENLKIESTSKPLNNPDGQEKELEDDVIKYINFMYDNIVDNAYSLPKKEIKEYTKLTYKKIDYIYTMLERLGIIQQTRINNIPKTEILYLRKNEAIEMIKNS